MNNKIKILHHKIYPLYTSKIGPTSTLTTSGATRKTSNVIVTTWNCRGISNSIPYLCHLIENGTDIIEHWLWPYNIDKLSHIHPDYVVLAFAMND